MTENPPGFRRNYLTEYDIPTLMCFKDEFENRRDRLASLLQGYKISMDEIISNHSLSLEQKRPVLKLNAQSEAAQKMISSLAEDIAMIDVELELRAT